VGLVDPARAGERSAKLEALMPMLEEVTGGGHKALVFSQFTSLLALVQKRLEEDGVPFEYLDGKTRDRAARVARFQNDPSCKIFLVSLKAGGVGLNLTAADYVFLLDPWWNPAVEAQAVDRTHRIGQSRKVFAYRLVAEGTIEEKVLELQAKKRGLADDIISGDGSMLRQLGRQDLELLLA
jgi:SNF2 family DNA or RNA helicase